MMQYDYSCAMPGPDIPISAQGEFYKIVCVCAYKILKKESQKKQGDAIHGERFNSPSLQKVLVPPVSLTCLPS